MGLVVVSWWGILGGSVLHSGRVCWGNATQNACMQQTGAFYSQNAGNMRPDLNSRMQNALRTTCILGFSFCMKYGHKSCISKGIYAF